MNLTKFVPAAVTKVVAPKVFLARKHSPVILFGTGVAGAIGATVLACRATLKLSDVLDEANEKLEKLELAESESFTPEFKSKAKAAVRVKAGMDIVKLYGPALILGAGSIASLTGSHYIMSKRQAGLMAAYAGLDRMYKEYQDRVRAELGEEKEEHLRHGFTSEKFVNDEGKKVSHVKINPSENAIGKWWGRDSSQEWTNNPQTNFYVLKAKQNYANDLLSHQGHVFLNEVYDLLGLKRTPEGSVLGWRLGGDGKNYIDFGIFNEASESVMSFRTGAENSVWLNFNIDPSPIYMDI